MVDFGRGAMVPFSHLIEELFELVAEDAAFFGCAPEVAHARTILQRGTSADRQLKRYAKVKSEGGSERDALVAVVDELVAETAAVPGAGTTTILEGENA